MTEGDSEPEQSTSAVAFASPPALVAGARAPLPRSARPASRDAFFRDAKICPDSTCVLAAAEDRSLSLFDLTNEASPEWKPRWTWQPSDALLSYEWFPGATSLNPPFFAFTAAVKDHPIHLLDGNDQRVRASYPIIDHRERFIAPHAMAFSPDGSKLYCGFENAIEILDVGRPGGTEESGGITKMRGKLQRDGKTNQRLGFDIDPTGQWLVAGDTNGKVSVFGAEFDPHNAEPVTSFEVAQGSVGSVNFTPDGKHLVTCAGARSFVQPSQSDDDDSDAEDEPDPESDITQKDSLQVWKL
ncbi:hypothetical protein RQP46_008802 [Phenoliferia psychrophenolica]